MAVQLQRQTDGASGPVIVFLPGIIAPAAIRYAPLLRELGDDVQAYTKDLEVYGGGAFRDGYTIGTEVDGLLTAADDAGIDRFYLYGHSAGGAVALAFAMAHPERLLGLALDEPASDFSMSTKAAWAASLEPIAALPENEQMAAFMQAQVAPDVQLQPPPPGPQPEWMASRPAGVRDFATAVAEYELPEGRSPLESEVYFSFGSRTNPIWREIRDHLSSRFAHFTSEEYEGLHHLNTSHAAEPARVASALRRVWQL